MHEDNQAFEAAIIADYVARTAVERELVLASLLWRMRRATAVETDDTMLLKGRSLASLRRVIATGGPEGAALPRVQSRIDRPGQRDKRHRELVAAQLGFL